MMTMRCIGSELNTWGRLDDKWVPSRERPPMHGVLAFGLHTALDFSFIEVAPYAAGGGGSTGGGPNPGGGPRPGTPF